MITQVFLPVSQYYWWAFAWVWHKYLQGPLNILNKVNYKKTAAADLFFIINIISGYV